MPDFRFRFAFSIAGLVLALTASRALAQKQPTATYDDWTVRCTSGAGAPPQKFCEMEQLSQLKGKEQPFSRVVIARPAMWQPLRLIAQLPVNVAIAAGVKIELGGKELPGAFTRCLPAGFSRRSRSMTTRFGNSARRAHPPASSIPMRPDRQSPFRSRSRASSRPSTRCRSNRRAG